MKRIPYIILSVILFWSCDDSDDSNAFTPGTDPAVETVVPTGNEQYLSLDSDYIFDDSKLHTFELNLPAAHLEQIDSDPTAEEYVEGSLTFEGETISPVGIRYKGSIGAYVSCLTGSDWANPSGSKTCTKLSMKIKINWGEREERFYGLKKLQLHSMNNDPTQLRDRLGYWLFRQMDVPAPRATHARLVINGVYVGLFALIEQIDGRFTRHNFENGKGNLYKEVWPLTFEGTAQGEQNLLAGLKTNEDENPSTAIMRTFAQELAAADETEMKAVVEKWMNLKDILSYIVVDRAIRHDDGPFHWYCNGGSCDNHNYFWYEEPDQQKLYLIPWDLDNAFENIIANRNFVTPIADSWGRTRNECQPFSFGLLQLKQRSANCDKLTRAWSQFDWEYDALRKFLNEGPLAENEADVMLDQWAEQIRAATIEAKAAHSDALDPAKWEEEIQVLKSNLVFARRN